MSLRNDWTTLGFASLGHYAVERLGIARRTAESRAGIYRACRHLPVVIAAYEDGRLGLEAAWLLARILAAHTGVAELQSRWVDHARAVTVKRLRDEWRALRLRELGSNEAMIAAPEPATDAEWHAALARPPGRSRERLRALQLPGVDDPHAATPVLSSADVCVRLRLPMDIARAFAAALEAARRRAEQLADAVPWDEPWAAMAPVSLRAAHAFSTRMRRVPTWVGLLFVLEDYADTWDDPAGFPQRRWDAVYAREGWRCGAPGCTARVHIEDHHIRYRSRSGGDELWNQLCLCRAHHQHGEHGLLAQCRGRAPLDVVWRLGRPELASWFRNERRLNRPARDEAESSAKAALPTAS